MEKMSETSIKKTKKCKSRLKKSQTSVKKTEKGKFR